MPARTIRLRLTLTYGIVFLLTGAVLLTIGYLLVRHNLEARPNLRAELKRLGLPTGPGQSTNPFRAGSAFQGDGGFGNAAANTNFGPGSFGREVFNTARAQLADQALHRLAIEYVLALLAMTGVSVAAGWLLAGRALAPLRAITATARRVSSRNLGERIALQGPSDELRELADTFDGMLSRLDAAFASQRHFVANASHELRTPLAIMRTELDVALADPDASADELRTMGEAVRETIDRSEGLIEALLMLARSEAISGREEPVNLTELVAACVTDLRARAEEAQVELQADLRPALVVGERSLLERMIANLLDNGIRHNVAGGHLGVTTGSSAGKAQLVVSNGGQVIDPERAAELTEPFRRLSRNTAGFGLGLSIVRSVAEAHHGSVSVEAPETGGLKVRVTLPAGSAPFEVGVSRRQRALTKS